MASELGDEFQDLAERRGFNGNNATIDLVLVDAPVQAVAEAVNAHAKGTTWQKNVYGKGVKATKQSYMVYRLAGHGWSMLQSVCGKPAGYELAREISRRLKARAMWLSLSDVASFMAYYLFDGGGAMIEILEDFGDHHGDPSHLPKDMVGSLQVESTGRGIFGSSARKVSLASLATPIDAQNFLDQYFKSENILAPVTGEWGPRAGMVKLDFPDIGADDIERLDFIGGCEAPAARPARVSKPEDDPEFLRMRAEAMQRMGEIGYPIVEPPVRTNLIPKITFKVIREKKGKRKAKAKSKVKAKRRARAKSNAKAKGKARPKRRR